MLVQGDDDDSPGQDDATLARCQVCTMFYIQMEKLMDAGSVVLLHAWKNTPA